MAEIAQRERERERERVRENEDSVCTKVDIFRYKKIFGKSRAYPWSSFKGCCKGANTISAPKQETVLVSVSKFLVTFSLLVAVDSGRRF